MDTSAVDTLHQSRGELHTLTVICRLIETAATEAVRGGHEQISLALLKDHLVTESLVSIADRRNRRVSAR